MRAVLVLWFMSCAAESLLAGSPMKEKPTILTKLRPRGGAQMALGDYAGAAAELFNNMRAPAALIGGSIVPMGFAAVPEIAAKDTQLTKRLKQLHMVVAILSLSAEIVAVIYSTIAINKLSETVVAPAASVTDLLKRDFELQWIGCNLNFLIGMLGFASLVGLRAWFAFGHKLGQVGLCAAASVLCHVISIINNGIAAGDGGGGRFANNFAGLFKRYITLLVADAWKKKGFLQLASGIFLAATLVLYAKVQPDDHD